MNQKEQEFYSLIGRISIGFSNLESQVIDIIGLLINVENEFVTQLLLEDNAISQNLKLLLKLNKYRYTQKENIKKLHSSIDKLRINRNLFIHGLWKIHTTEQNELIFVCETKRVEFRKVKYGIMTQLNNFLEFKIDDFEKVLIEIKECSEIARDILAAIRKEGVN